MISSMQSYLVQILSSQRNSSRKVLLFLGSSYGWEELIIQTKILLLGKRFFQDLVKDWTLGIWSLGIVQLWSRCSGRYKRKGIVYRFSGFIITLPRRAPSLIVRFCNRYLGCLKRLSAPGRLLNIRMVGVLWSTMENSLSEDFIPC